MGYNLYITRKQNWHDEEGEEITAEEWQRVAGADPAMRCDGYGEATTRDLFCPATIRVESPGIWVWTAYSRHGKDGDMAWVEHEPDNGCITTKNPDREIRRKLYELAQKLGATVQGEECEVYDAEGYQIGVPKPQSDDEYPRSALPVYLGIVLLFILGCVCWVALAHYVR
ncbi:MAG: hypothetical protein ACAI35_02890 [Candidatus Methylacidiphilales bacterium]|nr:hypothetical protein [Candidatus Methylacidiphilales bacterium]